MQGMERTTGYLGGARESGRGKIFNGGLLDGRRGTRDDTKGS